MPDYVTVIVEDLATGQHRRAGRVDVAEHEGHQAEGLAGAELKWRAQ
jgi:hypothetical protein